MKPKQIKIIFTTGVIIRITRIELFRLIHEPIVLCFFVFGGLIAAHISPLAISAHVSPTLYFILITLKSVAALILLHLVFLTFHFVVSYAKNLPLLSAVAMLVTALLLEIVWRVCIDLLLPPELIPETDFWGADLLTSCVAFILGEIFYSLFVLKMTAWWTESEKITQMDRRSSVAKPFPELTDVPDSSNEFIKSVMIGKEFVVLRELIYLKAEQHYVHFFMQNRTFLHRSRFEEAIDLLPTSLGSRTHRSYWVAWNAIQDVSVFKDGRGEIILASGERLPVSRSYRKQIVIHFSSRQPQSDTDQSDGDVPKS